MGFNTLFLCIYFCNSLSQFIACVSESVLFIILGGWAHGLIYFRVILFETGVQRLQTGNQAVMASLQLNKISEPERNSFGFLGCAYRRS